MTPSLGSIPINLPVLLESRMLIQANSGAGKSYTLRRILEQTALGVQQLVIDPEGEFASLREKFDYIVCAPHDADAVATPQTAAALARALWESGTSAILDIYELKAHERYPSGGCVALTDGGRAVANKPAKAPTLEDLHAGWLAMVTRPQAAILSPLIEHYPNAIPRDDLAALAGVSAASSGYANNLGYLRTLGAIAYREGKKVVATEILFPKGGRAAP